MCENPDNIANIYNKLLKNPSAHNNLIYAHHPFSQCYNKDVRVTVEYQTVCEDFGFKMLAAYHPWCKLSTDELWTLCGKFNWQLHNKALHSGHSTNVIASEFLDENSPEHQIYTNLFAGSYSWDQYISHIGLDK